MNKKKLISELGRLHFDLSTRSIRATPPLEKRPGKVKFVSLVCHKDLNRYLIAIKSVYSMIGEGEIVVLDDGTLTQSDIEILNHHLCSPDYYHAEDIDVGPCPSYICWKRIMLILELCQDNYVIQVDSDIVAGNSLDEVTNAVAADEAFILVNRKNPGVVKLRDMAAWVNEAGWQHKTVQVETEKCLGLHPEAGSKQYIRGSAAFVGWPKGCSNKAELEQFSTFVEANIGPLWRQWGSEQTSTNFLMGNVPKLRLLEYPRYVNNAPSLSVDQAALVHYYGTFRYREGRYRSAARKAISVLAA